TTQRLRDVNASVQNVAFSLRRRVVAVQLQLSVASYSRPTRLPARFLPALSPYHFISSITTKPLPLSSPPQTDHMGYGLLKGKRGIISGALNEQSIAWKVAELAHDEGAQFVLTNAPVAMRMGEINN